MRLPKQVRILGKTYNVEPDKNLIAIDEAAGKCSAHLQRIWICTEQAEDGKRDALLHEVMHGLWSEMGLSDDVPGTHEEPVIRRMATGLLQTLRANPKFVDYLLEDS
jgi:hypothetical protein